MATVAFFHAHPDDESIQTGGTMAEAARDGHRVILVLATRGEHGEVDEGFLGDGETLGQRRSEEAARSAEILGVARLAFLDHTDSGMIGTPENDLPGSFWSTPVEEAAEQLAALLREERVDVLSVYDSDGVYGHPDHIQVHRVGVRAAELAGTARVLEATMNRDHLRRIMDAAVAAGSIPAEEVPDLSAASTFGRPESVITTRVEVGEFTDLKRASMAAHASQIAEGSFFLTMPEEAFAETFGVEWFIRRDIEPSGSMDDDIFAGL